MAPTHDRIQSIFQAARQAVVDVTALEDGFENRVLARLGRIEAALASYDMALAI